jgi:hypothetical protein
MARMLNMLTERSTQNDVTWQDENDRPTGDGSKAELSRRSDGGGKEGVDGGDDDLEQRRVEVVFGDGDLNEDEKHPQRDRDEAVDERPVERTWLDERRAQPTDEKVLPEVVGRLGRHEDVKRSGGFGCGHLVVDDVPVKHVSGEKLAEVQTVGLLQELLRGNENGKKDRGEGEERNVSRGIREARRGRGGKRGRRGRERRRTLVSEV